MVLDVAAAAIKLGVDVLELAEDVLGRLADDVRQDVEPAAMGHGHDDRLDALPAGLFDGQIQQRDEAFGPFQRKALGADELAADELLEDHRVGQPGEDADLLVAAELQAVLRFLHRVLQPLADFQVVDVHELDADGPAVGVAEPVENVAERLVVRPGQRIGREAAVEVGFGKAPELRFQFWRHGPGNAQRIDLGDQVPADAIVADQKVDVFLLAGEVVQFPRPATRKREPRRFAGEGCAVGFGAGFLLDCWRHKQAIAVAARCARRVGIRREGGSFMAARSGGFAMTADGLAAGRVPAPLFDERK